MFRNSVGSQTFADCLFFIIVPDSTDGHIHLKGKSLMDPQISVSSHCRTSCLEEMPSEHCSLGSVFIALHGGQQGAESTDRREQEQHLQREI